MQASDNYCRKLTGFFYESNAYYKKGALNKSNNILLEIKDMLSNAPINCNYFQSSFLVGKTCEDCLQIVNLNIYRKLFYIAKNKNNYNDALKYLLKRKEIVEGLADKNSYYYKNKVDVDQSLALLKIKLENYESAFHILKQAHKELDKIDISKSSPWHKNFILQKANILNSLGDVCVYLNSDFPKKSYLDSASVYYKESFNILKKSLKKNVDSEILYKIREVNIFIRKKDYKSALFYLNRYSQEFEKLLYLMPDVYYYKSTAHKHLQNNDSSIYYSKKYINYYKRLKNESRGMIFVYDNLRKSYSVLKENDSALKYSNLTLRKYKNIETNKKSTNKYIYDIELNTIETINKGLTKKYKSSQKFWYILLVLLVITVIGIFIFFFVKNKNKNKTTINSIKHDKEFVEKILSGLSKFDKTQLYLDKDFNIKKLAELLNTNTTYLSSIINNYKNQTFKYYLSELRINFAVKKMNNDQKFLKFKIESMGKEVGYSNASSFTRAFKRIKNITPSEYIKLNFP